MKPKTWTLPKFKIAAKMIEGNGVADSEEILAGILERLWFTVGTFDKENAGSGLVPQHYFSGRDSIRELFLQFGWLDERGESLYVHDWKEHKPKHLKDAERKRNNYQPKKVAEGSGVSRKPLKTAPPSDSDSDSDSVRKKKKRESATFKRPSVEEVAEYEPAIDAQAFYDHYESCGWKVGKNSMKDWKAAVRNWKRRAGEFRPTSEDTRTVKDRIANALRMAAENDDAE